MKRVLVCTGCVQAWARLIGKYPGETVKVVRGLALNDYVCDDCGKSVDAKHFAAAVSVSTATTPYTAWEHDYVKQFPPQFQSAQAPLPVAEKGGA